MKKYITIALLVFASFGLASAQVSVEATATSYSGVIGDVPESSMMCTALTNNLRLRSRDSNTNNEVTALQEFLQDSDLLETDPTGYFGVATQRAVKVFQKQNGLLASGFVGEFTRKAIKEKSCNQSTVTPVVKKETEVYACTMEYRSCADGSPMPREANCTWREDKCPSQVKSTKPDSSSASEGLGEYIGYINGEIFIKTQNISKEEAYKNCTLNNRNNASKLIKCTWNGVVIYSNRTDQSIVCGSSQTLVNGVCKEGTVNYTCPNGKVVQVPQNIEPLLAKKYCPTPVTETNKLITPTVKPFGLDIPINANTPIIRVSVTGGEGAIAIGQPISFKWITDNTEALAKETNGVAWAGAFIENVNTGQRIFLGDAMLFTGGEAKREIPLMSEGVKTSPGTYRVMVYIYAKGGNRAVGYSEPFRVISVPTTSSVGDGQGFNVGSVPQVLGAKTMCVNLSRNLFRGDESEETRLLQTFLNNNEFMDSEVSGFYGDKTIEAVKRYQRIKGLPQTGMVFDFTRKMIAQESCN